MTKRISELPAAGAVADTDEFELNQSGASRKATRGQIVAGLAGAVHQHGLADITDAGALAGLDSIGTAAIDADAYASSSEAAAGTDDAKIMTPLRTAEAIAAQAAAPEHQHGLADITDAGALAALDAIGPTEIAPSAYATQTDAVEGLDGTRIMTAARTAEAVAAHAAPLQHQHDLADITDAGALAGLDAVGAENIAAAAYASQSEALAGTDDTKLMTPLRTAQAIAAQPGGAPHEHTLADITDAGALAALDAVGTAEISPTAYASQSDALEASDETKIMTPLRTAEAVAAQAAPLHHQHDLADLAATAFASESEAVAGTDNSKLMTPLRTAQAIAAQPAGQEHQHTLADITDAGALAALDALGTAEIEPAAYASQGDAVAGTDNAKLMTALRTAEAIAAQVPADHQHDLADITDAGALAALHSVGAPQIDADAYASAPEAIAGTENSKLMTALRTAEAIAAQAAPLQHQHELAAITDAGALASLDSIGTDDIAAAAYASQSEAEAGTNDAKIMTPLRTAQAIAAQPPGAPHQHSLADIIDSGALAALDAVGTAEIDAAAYATQSDALAGADETKIMTPLRTAEAVAAQAAPLHHQHELADIAATAFASESEALAGTDNSKLMTPLRTAQAIAAQPAGQEHQHTLADVTDAGALAALDTVGTAEIDAAAYASQGEAVAGTDSAKLMTPLRTAEAIAAQPPAHHSHDLADVTDAGALAALDSIATGHIDASAYASQSEAIAGTENSKIMTALRTAQAIVALAPEHQHTLADITNAGALASLNTVGAAQIQDNAVTAGKIAAGAVTETKIATNAVTGGKIASAAVTETKIGNSAVTTAKIADGAVTTAKIADGAVGAGKLQPGIPIDMQDALLRAPELRDYSETSPTPGISGGTLSLDLETGNAFEVVLTQNVTSLQLVNPPAAGRAGSCSLFVRQDATGGRTLAWPASVKWAGGVAPTVTSPAHGVDVYALITRDGGTTWYGFLAGHDFS